MLVLSRKPNQEVCLPDLGVSFRVLQIGKTSVRIGIDAPDEIHVLRGELSKLRQAPAEVVYSMASEER